MIDDPRLFIRLFPEEQILGYNDEIRYMIDFDRNDNLIIYTGKKMLNEIIPKDEMMLDNKLNMIINNMTVEDVVNLDYKDTIEVSNKLNNNDIIHLKTVNGLSNIIIPKNWFNTEDILKLYNILHAIETMEFNYKDIMELRSNLDLYNNIELKQIVGLSNILVGKSTIPNLHDTLTLCIVLNVLDSIELNYKDIIVKMTAGCTIEEKIKLLKPMSTDKEYVRQSLIPANLKVVDYNNARGVKDICIYEIANTYFTYDNYSLWEENGNYGVGNWWHQNLKLV